MSRSIPPHVRRLLMRMAGYARECESSRPYAAQSIRAMIEKVKAGKLDPAKAAALTAGLLEDDRRF